MLTQEEFSQYQNYLFKIECYSKQILNEINEIDPIDGFEFLKFKSCDDEDVTFEGEEYYMGYPQEYIYYIPVDTLYDEKRKEDFLSKIRKEKEEYEIRVQKEKERQRREDSIKEFARLLVNIL